MDPDGPPVTRMIRPKILDPAARTGRSSTQPVMKKLVFFSCCFGSILLFPPKGGADEAPKNHPSLPVDRAKLQEHVLANGFDLNRVVKFGQNRGIKFAMDIAVGIPILFGDSNDANFEGMSLDGFLNGMSDGKFQFDTVKLTETFYVISVRNKGGEAPKSWARFRDLVFSDDEVKANSFGGIWGIMSQRCGFTWLGTGHVSTEMLDKRLNLSKGGTFSEILPLILEQSGADYVAFQGDPGSQYGYGALYLSATD